MAITPELQPQKDLAIKAEKERFLRQATILATELRSNFFAARALLSAYFSRDYGSTLNDDDVVNSPYSLEDLINFMGALEAIGTQAEDVSNQWVAKVNRIAECKDL